jgi:hypothetical protein
MPGRVNREIIILAGVALGAMAAGFLLVMLILGPAEKRTLPDPFEGSGTPGDASGARTAPAEAVARADAAGAPPPEQEQEQEPAEEPPPSPPPPETAAQASVSSPPAGQLQTSVGDPFVWRCWPEGSETHEEKEACGSLEGVSALVDDHLGMIEQCVIEHAGRDATGKLSLALKVDFADGSVNAWLGNSTTVPAMNEVSACLRDGYEHLSPPSVSHEHPRYIVFFNVEVG